MEYHENTSELPLLPDIPRTASDPYSKGAINRHNPILLPHIPITQISPGQLEVHILYPSRLQINLLEAPQHLDREITHIPIKSTTVALLIRGSYYIWRVGV